MSLPTPPPPPSPQNNCVTAGPPAMPGFMMVQVLARPSQRLMEGPINTTSTVNTQSAGVKVALFNI